MSDLLTFPSRPECWTLGFFCQIRPDSRRSVPTGTLPATCAGLVSTYTFSLAIEKLHKSECVPQTDVP